MTAQGFQGVRSTLSQVIAEKILLPVEYNIAQVINVQWVYLAIALFVVAAAVGLGVGISRAVGGGVWSGNGQSKQIPANN